MVLILSPSKTYDLPALRLHVCAVLQLHLREIVPGQYRRDLISCAENILQVLWFYYAVAFLATAGAILFRCAVCASPALRCRIILTRRTAETRKIYRGIRNGTVSCPTSAPPDLILQYVDWFWLRQIRRNADDVFFEELLDSLYKDHGEGLWSRRPGRGGLGNDEDEESV